MYKVTPCSENVISLENFRTGLKDRHLHLASILQAFYILGTKHLVVAGNLLQIWSKGFSVMLWFCVERFFVIFLYALFFYRRWGLYIFGTSNFHHFGPLLESLCFIYNLFYLHLVFVFHFVFLFLLHVDFVFI